MSNINYKDYIKVVENFPVHGVTFRDISPLLKECFNQAIDEFCSLFLKEEWESVDYVTGIESRGFILAAAIAYKMKKGFVMIRKSGKLPLPEASYTYSLEYGDAKIEMHNGAGNLMIVDDVLATGGTLQAAYKLSKKAGYTIKLLGALVDLKLVKEFHIEGMGCRALIDY